MTGWCGAGAFFVITHLISAHRISPGFDGLGSIRLCDSRGLRVTLSPIGDIHCRVVEG